MKAAVLQEPFRVELIDRTLPPLGAGQALMRIEQCGLCTSEIDLWTGKAPDKLPAAIGHEVAGIIEQTGPGVESLQVGDRVAAWMDGGGFAEAAVVDARHCVPIAPEVTFPAVAEPLACVINAVEAAAPALGDDVAIIGCGFMGVLVQLVTALKGPRSITAVDFRDDALERAAVLGATRVVNPKTQSPADIIREETDGRGADVTYEATGANAGLELAGELTRMSGKIGIVGYHQGGTRTIPLSHWNWMAFDIINAHFRRIDTIMAGMRAGMRLVNAGVLDVRPLLTNVYPLARIAEALETAAAKPNGFLKAVIDVNGE